MTSPTVQSPRPRVAIVGDDRVAAQIIARGVPGYEVQRASAPGADCDLVHRVGTAPAVVPAPGLPVLTTAEEPRNGAVAWHPGVDLRRFNPGRARGLAPLPGEITVLHAGRRADLVAEAFAAARTRDGRLHLLVDSALEPLDDDARAATYARAAILVAIDGPERTVLEAQASGLAVIAAGAAGPVRDGHTGRVCPAEPRALAATILELTSDAAERARLGRAARYSTRARSCEVAMVRLAALYDQALGVREPARAAAA
jgi:hypothetical protein